MVAYRSVQQEPEQEREERHCEHGSQHHSECSYPHRGRRDVGAVTASTPSGTALGTLRAASRKACGTPRQGGQGSSSPGASRPPGASRLTRVCVKPGRFTWVTSAIPTRDRAMASSVAPNTPGVTSCFASSTSPTRTLPAAVPHCREISAGTTCSGGIVPATCRDSTAAKLPPGDLVASVMPWAIHRARCARETTSGWVTSPPPLDHAQPAATTVGPLDATGFGAEALLESNRFAALPDVSFGVDRRLPIRE